MQEWIRRTLDSPELGLALLPAALALGLVGSASSCCTPAVFGLMAGYSGSAQRRDGRAIVLAGVFFLLGTVAALAALGAVAGFLSQLAGNALGRYWQIFGGLVAVLLGLAALRLLPFRLPRFGATKRVVPRGAVGASLFGFVVGGASLACTVSCNPLIAVPLGLAALQGKILWGAAMLAAFAVGYSLPLAAVLIGMQAGAAKLKGISHKTASAVKSVAGILLIAAGFYLLATV